MSDDTKAEAAAAYEAIARRVREDRLIAYCHTYEGDSTAHTLIRRLVEELAQARALLAAVRPVVQAAARLDVAWRASGPVVDYEDMMALGHACAALPASVRAWAEGGEG